jgi:hypothetical protein
VILIVDWIDPIRRCHCRYFAPMARAG